MKPMLKVYSGRDSSGRWVAYVEDLRGKPVPDSGAGDVRTIVDLGLPESATRLDAAIEVARLVADAKVPVLYQSRDGWVVA